MKYRVFRCILHQINPSTVELEANIDLISSILEEDKKIENLKLAVFPELALTGYLKRDLFLSHRYLDKVSNALERIIEKSKDADYAIILGAPYRKNYNTTYNSLYLIYRGKVIDVYHKMRLVSYGPFDEQRYFRNGDRHKLWSIDGTHILASLCADTLFLQEKKFKALNSDYELDLLISCNASLFERGKAKARKKVIMKFAQKSTVHFIYLNMVGGEDELVFDGGSFVADGCAPDRKTESYVEMSFFREESFLYDFQIAQLPKSKRSVERRACSIEFKDQSFLPFEKCWPSKSKSFQAYHSIYSKLQPNFLPEDDALKRELIKIYNAILLSIRDYFIDGGFDSILIALSGGIDSSLTTVMAIDAVGTERTEALFMPSRFTGELSRASVAALQKTLGLQVKEVEITKLMDCYLKEITAFSSSKLAQKNLQSRVRANILLTMANLSKKTLVLCTGNKSELLVGFETLGGDLLGGFAPIKDLFKSEVVQLAVARNRFEKRRSNSLIIPNFIIERKPTAELWPDEFDEDELGEYSKIEESFELRKLNDFAYTASFKEDRFYRNEFKRRVAPIGPKLSNLSLNSIEYRFPINHIG